MTNVGGTDTPAEEETCKKILFIVGWCHMMFNSPDYWHAVPNRL